MAEDVGFELGGAVMSGSSGGFDRQVGHVRGSSSSLRLRAISPDGSSNEVFLTHGMTIGRTSANVLRAEDDSGLVERTHAQVEFGGDGKIRLKCIQPESTVYSNDGDVSTVILDLGTVFQLGKTRFEVVSGRKDTVGGERKSVGGCPYCGHQELPPANGKVFPCPDCQNPIVLVPAGVAMGGLSCLPGEFRDVESAEYSVERFVARGGMGYVLKGTDEQGKAVAIKVLIWEEGANEQAVLRFQQEIELLQEINDPNVLRLVSHGKETGFYFYVMDWVDGNDLRSVLPKPGKPETRVEFAKALAWFEQACQGLLAIHRAGIVHRDIKPSNLLLTADGKLLIADLGVAKQLNENETGMTSTGQMPGTYWYMAPEQHYAPDLVDQRTDMYSLAFTFWELLTGARPNVARPKPPSEVNPTVPKEFDEILFSMLESEINNRPLDLLVILKKLSRGKFFDKYNINKSLKKKEELPKFSTKSLQDSSKNYNITTPISNTYQSIQNPANSVYNNIFSLEIIRDYFNIWITVGSSLAVFIIFLNVGNFFNGITTPPQPPPPPPVPIMFSTRSSSWGGGNVCQFFNYSNKEIHAVITVSNTNKTSKFNFKIPAGYKYEHGWYEGWNYLKGDRVEIDAPGFSKQIFSVQ